MSRASYGADVFSPVKSNVSFNDDGLKVGRESDLFDQWREPYGAAGKNRNTESKKKNPYVPYLHTDETSSKGNLQSSIKVDSVVEKKKKVDLTKLSFVTTRSKNSHKSRKESGETQESQPTQNDKVSKTRKKNYATVRPEVDSNKEFLHSKIRQNKESYSLVNHADSNKELPPNKIEQNEDSASSVAIPDDSNKHLLPSKTKQHKDSFSPSLTGLAEDQTEKSPELNNIDSMKSDHNSLGLSEVRAQTHKFPSKRNVILKKDHSKNKNEKPVFTPDCEVDNLKLLEEVNPDKRNQEVSAVTENSTSQYASASSDFKPVEQTQANIIEKLVRDAVSFEFDGVRQMLYLQHLQLLNYIDKNAVNCDLQKTIEELVEENTRLKNIIAHQNT